MASKGAGKYEEDLDDIDFNNYRGIYFEDEPGKKYQDPDTGAHFDFKDMCKRLYPYSQKQKSRQEAESRANHDRPSPLNQHLLQQTNEIQRIFHQRKRKGKSKGPESPEQRLTFGKENIHQPLNESLYSTAQQRFASLSNEEDFALSNRSGAIGPAEIQRIQKGLAFTSSGSRNIGPAGPVVTKVKATESESSHKRPTQFLSMQGASRKQGGSRNLFAQQAHSLSMDQQQQQSLKQTRLLSYQQGLPVNDLPGNQRHKTPEVYNKKGPRAMMEGQSASKLGDNSLERKTYDGGVNFSQGSTELKKIANMDNYSSTASNRKAQQMGRTGSGNVGEISKNFASFYANRRKPMGSNYLQQAYNNRRSSTGKYSIGNGLLSQTKVIAKKPSKGYLKKTGSGMTSLNLHLYGSTGKSRNQHTKHANSLQNYSATHQQQVMSMDGRASNSTLKLSEPKSPDRARKIVIPQHQISTSSGQYNLQGGHSRNLGLSIHHHSSGMSGGSIGAVNLTAGGGASGRKKIGSYAYESKKSGIAQQRRSETKVKSNYRFQLQ